MISWDIEQSERADLLLVNGDIKDQDIWSSTNASIIVIAFPYRASKSDLIDDIYGRLINLRGSYPPSSIIVIQQTSNSYSSSFQHITNWFIEFVRNLSHNNPLLRSAFDACNNAHVKSLPFLFTSNNPHRNDRRLSEVVSAHLQEMHGADDRWFELNGSAATRLRLTPGLRPIAGIPKDKLDFNIYDQESNDATTIAELFRSLSKTFTTIEIDANRWLQAQVLSKRNNTVDNFVANEEYIVRVWIGPETPGSIRADVRFPSDKLDWTSEVEQLTVVFTEPTFARKPQIRTIDLPQLGHSTTCDFTLNTTLLQGTVKQPSIVRARIAILHRNRVLQTAILTDELNDIIVANKNRMIRLEIEGVMRPDLKDLRERTRYDAAIIVNETMDHEHTMVTVSSLPDGDTQSTFRPLTDVIDTMKLLSKELTKIATYEQPPNWDSPEVTRLFKFLATHGYEIYRVLVKEQTNGIAERLENATHLQVVAADEQVYFPIELFYTRPPPLASAQVCPSAKEALQQNACPKECLGNQKPDDYVCPMGFLGMQKIIERHVCRSEASKGLHPGSFRLQLEPSSKCTSLPVFQRIVYGASKRVWEYKPPLMPSLTTIIDSLCPDDSLSVANWEELKTKSAGVSLLVLMPHCQFDQLQKYESLEIGTASVASSMVLSDLRRAHLGLKAEEKRPVIVFLMGCETGSPDADYRGFAAKFREQGAAIVVTALSRVLGRQVVPVTEALLLGIKEALTKGTSIRLGELLTQQRRKLLADGYALVLGITAYGDADWQLVGTRAQPTLTKEVTHAIS